MKLQERDEERSPNSIAGNERNGKLSARRRNCQEERGDDAIAERKNGEYGCGTASTRRIEYEEENEHGTWFEVSRSLLKGSL